MDKVELLMQKRAQCNFKEKFKEAQSIVATNPNIMARATSHYTLYLFYFYGWGLQSKDESLAWNHLQASTDFGYPVAAMEWARHLLDRKNARKAKQVIQRCEKAFLKTDPCEQEKLREDHVDMMRLLKVIESCSEDG